MAAMIKIVTLGETQAHVVITTRQEYESFKNVTFLEKKSLQEVGNVPDKKIHNKCFDYFTSFECLEVVK